MTAHLFVIDPLSKLNPNGDSSFAFMLEAQRRGHLVSAVTLDGLHLHDNQASADVDILEVFRPSSENPGHYRVLRRERKWLADFDVIWMRKDPPVDATFAHATMILDFAERAGVKMINRPSSLRVANEKLWGMQFNQWMPPTLVSASADEILTFADIHQEIIIKPIDRAGGWGILQFNANDRNLKSAIEVLTQTYQEHIIAQKYLPEVRKGDKRILLADGELIGAMWRIPAQNDHRANMHVGGQVAHAELSPTDQEIINTIKEPMNALGLRFVGIDIIGEYLTEINVTSPTGIQEMDRLAERDDAHSLSQDVFAQFGID